MAVAVEVRHWTVRQCVRHHSVRKWKDIIRFEIRYFFLKKKVSKFKPHYMLSLSTGLRAPVYSECATILGCVRHISACYCKFLRKVRLGGWGSEGPKGLTSGQYV